MSNILSQKHERKGRFERAFKQPYTPQLPTIKEERALHPDKIYDRKRDTSPVKYKTNSPTLDKKSDFSEIKGQSGFDKLHALLASLDKDDDEIMSLTKGHEQGRLNRF